MFEHFPVLILPGFVGRTADRSWALMGRGGSDLTALFAAQRLGARECRLLKDVDGLCTSDPRPLRVSLLGLGTVGLGVYQGLIKQKSRFQAVGIAIRHRNKTRETHVPPELLVEDARSLLDRPTDVVVELIGGSEPAASLIRSALEAGRHVVTANKDVIACHGDSLQRLAYAKGVELKFSASVGGAVPVIEQVRKLARYEPIERIEGVLNGTCNYVLDRMVEGEEHDDAVRAAQEQGFAEADPSLDLSGKDSAHKVAILAKAAFGMTIHPEEIPCRGIEDIDSSDVRKALIEGRVIKLVATCYKTAEEVRAEVRPVALPEAHPLAGARGEENRIQVQPRVGQTILLHGKGAGRWPTSLSVMADLLDLHPSSHRCRGETTPAGVLKEVPR
jgi:homoserine dehydrogenase